MHKNIPYKMMDLILAELSVCQGDGSSDTK